MSDCDADSCSPLKRARIDSSSSSSSNGSSESSTDEQPPVSTSSRTISLTAASIIDRCQPLSFILTKVEGIESRFNQSQALDIRGNVCCCKDKSSSVVSRLFYCSLCFVCMCYMQVYSLVVKRFSCVLSLISVPVISAVLIVLHSN